MANSTENNEQPSRPASPARVSPYDSMVVESHQVQSLYNILAAVFNWLVLAGFVVFPATFASLNRVGVLNNSSTGRAVQNVIRNIPLLYISAFACVLGGLGLAWLWWTVKHNYVWLLGRIFLPGSLNSVTALLTTLVSVYTAQSGNWSITALFAVCAISTCAVVNLSMAAVYEFWFLRRLKQAPVFEMA